MLADQKAQLNNDQLLAALAEAHRQCRYAYEFNPSSLYAVRARGGN